MDTSYSNSSASSSSSTSSESPVPPPSPERMSTASAASDSPISPRMTINQSVQTSVVRNGLHLNNNVGRCTSVDGPPRSLPAVVRTRNQMSQTNSHYLPLVHKPVQKQQQQQQQPKTNFNLNYPVTRMPPCIMSFQQQQQQQQQQPSPTKQHQPQQPPQAKQRSPVKQPKQPPAQISPKKPRLQQEVKHAASPAKKHQSPAKERPPAKN